MQASYENHQFANGALDMQDISALDSNHTSLYPKWWQQDVRAIVLNNLAHLVQSFEQNCIKLSISNHHWLHKDLGGHDKIMQALFGTNDALGSFSRNIHQVIWSSLSTRGRIPKESGEWWWEVNSSVGGRFDHLDVLAATAANQRVHGQLELHGINVSLEL